MNKIYKVIYSKVRQCYVVVSEIAKSHGRNTKSSVNKSGAALTAAVLIALGAVSFADTPVVQADVRNNDFLGANYTYWYWDEDAEKWETYKYKGTTLGNNRKREDLPNYNGKGAKEPGAITAGLYAQAGGQTITIGDRNAGQSKGSVFIGEQGMYNDGGKNDPSEKSMHNNYVTAVGFQSDATGWGSIAIGSNAVAENTKEISQVVEYEGSAGTSGTVTDDNYGIKLKPEIKWSSVALGYNAHAKDGNIAIGADSEATDTSSATPYVSVGNSNLKRRITNVADGDAATDVATVGQMNKAIEAAGATGWTLSTNGSTSGTTIKSGTRVDFSPAVDGKNGTADHSNVAVSNTDSNVKIGLNRNIVLGEATSGNGGSLNVYSDSTEASNLGNRVSIDGSTVSVNYGSEKGTSGTKRGVVLGVGEDYNNNAQGYIAFNNIDAKRRIGSTYLHSATDAPNDLKGRLVYSNAIDGTEYIANLDDGITFTGDVNGTVPEGYTQTPTKLNTTLNITGGATTKADLTSGNIGVVSTPAAEKEDGTTQASKLEIKLNKDLKGITSITGQSTTGAKIELGENGTTISGGDVNVSGSKVTGLAEGEINNKSTDAITGKQLDSVRTALTNSLSVNAGWGLEKENNTIRLNRNLGQKVSLHYKDNWDAYDATLTVDDTCLILGGEFDAEQIRYCSNIKYHRDDYTNWGAKGTASIISGGADNLADGTADAVFGGILNQATGTVTDDSHYPGGWNTVSGGAGNLANGSAAAVFGGWVNTSTGSSSTVTGGAGNLASGSNSAVFGGESNISSGSAAVISGGVNNRAMSVDSTVIGGNKNATINLSPSVIGGRGERGYYATVIGGTSNYASGFYSLALGGGGYQYGSDSDGNRYVHEGYYVRGDTSVGIDGGSTGNKAAHSLAAGNQSVVTVANGTAIGYQATTDEKGTIAFGHDKGDISGYTVRWKQKATSANGKYYDAKGVEITKDQYEALRNPDYTFNDYSKDPTITEDTHKTAAYNRLVKAADGQNAHDAVVMEQLNPYTKSDASNIGSNLKTYTVGDDGETITEAEASTDAKNTNENAWGAALGNGSIADPTQSATNDPKKNGSQQLVTGGTVYKALHGGLDDIVIGHDGKDGSIGLVGPTGPKGEDGTTIIKTEKGADGIDGKNGKDGITRIVYGDKDNPNDKHTVATLDDGMKYAGDTGDAAKVKLDHQLTLSGTTFNKTDKQYKEEDWTSDNIAVVSSAADETTGDATMYLKLNKDLNLTDKGSVRFGDKDSSTTLDASGLTIKSTVTEDGNTKTVNGPSMTKNGINGGGKQITNIGDGITTDGNGKYTVTDENKGNAANISDVQNIVNDAKKDLTDGANGLNSKANVDASNIGSNIKVYQKDENGKVLVDEKNQPILDTDATKTAQETNANKWGTAIGNGSIADPTQSATNDPKKNGSQQLVTGGTVYKALHGGLDDIVIGHDGKDGSIGLVGPTGPKGEDGTTIIKTEKGADGIDGKNGKDGITRIVYGDKDNPNDKHTVATLDDGMKYAGDTGDAAKVKLDHQLTLSGTTFNKTDKQYKEEDWTSDNIAVVSSAADETTGDATMYLKLNKDLNLTDKGSVRFGDKDSSTTLDASGLTIKSTVTEDGNTKTVNGPSMTKNGINGGGKQITNIGDGITTDGNGKYTVTDENKGNAANISDVQNIVNDAKKDLTNGANGLNSKANVDASNIGENMKDAKGNKASAAEITKNKEAWASAIGTDTVAKGNKQLVTSDAVATALDSKADKTYVDEQLNTKANKSDVYTKDQTYSKSEVNSKVTDITKGLDGKAGKDLDNISDKGKDAIRDLAKGSVKVIDGMNTKVSTGTEGDATTYAVNVEGNGKVASGDTGLISGDTLYKEVHVDTDGSYIKGSQTVGQNLSNLDTGLKTTSDLIHTNEKGDTIQIGGDSKATKIDFSGKDAKGNTTGRVITGVVSDASDPNSAANVGYVNGITEANNEQIYRDMNMQYNHVENDISRAAAGSNALAALHPMQEFDPDDKAQFALGYGHYRNSNAGAVGAFYQPDENSMVNFGVSFGNGDAGINAGVTFKFGPGGSGHHALTKTQMAKVIDAQSKEIDELKKDNADKDKRIDALEQKMTEILAKLDKSKD